MPEISFDNADSPIFREDSGKASAESGASKPAPSDSGKKTESGTAQKPAESGKTESGKTGSEKTGSAATESTKTESVKAEPEKIYEDPKSASAISLSRVITVKEGKTSCELTAISTETNEASSEYTKLNAALKEIPEGEALPVRADTNVVSLIIREEPGSAELTAVNIDTETGDDLTISDIFSDEEKLADAIVTQYGKDHPDLPALTLKELDPEEYVWTLSPDGCVFYFPDPKNKDKVIGTLLLRSANEELFREKGTTVPETFVRAFEINEDYYFDRDGDGTTDRICVSASRENGRYKKAEITLNGQSVTCHVREAERFVPMIMEAGDGLWLYLACEENEGPGDIAVVDISKDPSIFLGVPTRDTGIPYRTNEYGWAETLPGDPRTFLLESTVDLITSFPAVAEYKAGADGVPEQTGKVYMANGETVLESLAKMKVDLIDPDTGETVEKGRIFEAGSRWTVVRSDGETYIDFDVNGEGLVRLSGDSSGTWPEKIGGTAVGKLFKEVSDNS